MLPKEESRQTSPNLTLVNLYVAHLLAVKVMTWQTEQTSKFLFKVNFSLLHFCSYEISFIAPTSTQHSHTINHSIAETRSSTSKPLYIKKTDIYSNMFTSKCISHCSKVGKESTLA